MDNYFQMMQVVPSCASPNYFSPSYSPDSSPELNFEFDLNLLPSSDCADVVPGLDLPLPLSSDPLQEVPSPSSSFSCLDSNLQSPTMFSPSGDNEKTTVYTSYVMTSSPVSLPPSSPYSPVGNRPNRLSSTDSMVGRLTDPSSGSSSIRDSILELNELRSHFRQENSAIPPPPPYVMPQGLLIPKTEPQTSTTSEHRCPLLRQVLEDFSFGGGFGGAASETEFRCEVKSELDDSLTEAVNMSPVISLAVEQVKKDIDTTCQILRIVPEPARWSREDVTRWMSWTMSQFNVLTSSPIHDWAIDGARLVQMTEQQFKEKFPQGGEFLFAQLDLWRSNANCNQPPPAPPPLQQQQSEQQQNDLDLIDLMAMMEENSESFEQPARSIVEPPPAYPGTPPEVKRNPEDFFVQDEDDDEGSDTEVALPTVALPSTSPIPHTPPTPNRSSSSSNIHLWQFVKELLNEPQLHSGCIHWVDREKGIFKIVDSVRVAHLWGKRKNRPAMNYDKLSRSLRQYYKKGIMKKTERTQRLVYQFCSPYHL